MTTEPSFRRVAVGLVLVAILNATPLVAGGDEAQRTRLGRWPVGLVAVDQADLPQALGAGRYEVDIFGAVAVGTLVQQLVHNGQGEREVTVEVSRAFGLKIESIEVSIAGDAVASMAPPPGKRRQPAPRVAAGLRSGRFRIEAGETAEIRIGFQAPLSMDGGRFRLQLPAPTTAGDASPEAPLTAELRLRFEAPLAEISGNPEEPFVSYHGDHTLAEMERPDPTVAGGFELTFEVGADETPTLVSYVGSEKDGLRDVMLVLTPPLRPPGESIRPRQLLFVLDTSGSMNQGKLEQARVALRSCLDKLRPDDRFNIIEFDSKQTMLQPEPVGIEDVSAETASAWLGGLRAGGGTDLLPALDTTFGQPEDLARHRMIVVLTDGAFRNQQAVFDLVDRSLGDGRLFVVGIGQDVRRPTVLSLAERGRGEAAFTEDSEGLDAALAALFDSIAEPVAWDLELDWGGAEVESLSPRRVPDLYAGRPVQVTARVRGPLPPEVRVQSTTMHGARTFSSMLPPPVDGLRLPAARDRAAEQRGRGRVGRPGSR